MSSRLSETSRRIACQSRLISAMPPDLRAPLLDAARIRRYSRGRTIFRRGDTARALHIVAKGWVKLYRIAPNGTEAVVSVMTQGRSFGEPIALRKATYPVSAEASTECCLIEIPAKVLLASLHESPEVAVAVLSSTFVHLQGLVEQIEALKAQSGAQRVAEFLLDLCPADVESATVVLPYEKLLIAGRLGMKPESLSRAFARLRDHGVRINQTSAAIASVSRLQQLLGDDAGAALSRAN